MPVVRTRKILLADDSPSALTLHRLILDGNGYHVVTARDGEEAVRKAASEGPDLILMDFLMPRMSGVDAVKELRERNGTRDTPVIMVISRVEPLVIELCFEAGCNDYVSKPVDSAVLLSKVRSFIGD
ncbi:MAG: response regulator [Gemmatimonadales bacterium]